MDRLGPRSSASAPPSPSATDLLSLYASARFERDRFERIVRACAAFEQREQGAFGNWHAWLAPQPPVCWHLFYLF